MEQYRETRLKYRRSKFGLISTIYKTQKQNSKRRGYDLPSYTKDELVEWFNNHDEFLSIYSKWVESNYNPKFKPSIDRIDDYKSYSFDNIQLVTFEENNNRGYSDRKNGINNKINKEVIQYRVNGEYVNTFHSISEAERNTNINLKNISAVCLGKRKTAGGFIWKYIA